MSYKDNVFIESVRGSEKDYIIKDSSGITTGRFSILEFDSNNRKATLRLKFYKENNYELLKKTLERVLKVIFNNKNIFKVNIFTPESINLSSFLDIGFSLEGILSNNIYSDKNYSSELIFGINLNDFNDNLKIIQLEVSGERVSLRILSPDNAEEMLKYYIRNEKHLKMFEPTRESSFYTYESQRELLIQSYKQFMNGTTLDFGIFKDNKLIGKIKLSNIVYGVFQSGFIGYSIDEQFQGKGYMKEAVNLLCDYAFKEMGLHRLEASTLDNNNKSQFVLKRCGFNELGINKKYLFINGEWRDHITFYKIKE